jgi:hypothetical protein
MINSIDTRDEISKIANLSYGTMDKVKKIKATATPEVKKPLDCGFFCACV